MSSSQQYRLHWLREAKGGLLTGLGPAPTVSLGSLPINETLAARILAATPVPAAGADEAPPLHLPYVSHRDRFKWPTRQLELAVAAMPDGRIVVGDDAELQMAGLLTTHPAPLVFTDRRTWDPADWHGRVAPLLEAHQMQPPPGWHPARPFEVTMTIELPAAMKFAWRALPRRRDAQFLDQFRGLSTAIQRALRIWMPYQYFHQPGRLAAPLKCHQYLVYSNLPPFPSERKTQLTFHVLEPQRVIHSINRRGKLLGELLRHAARRARSLGIDALPYSADDATAILRAMHKMPRVFGALLSLEAFLVEEFILFSARCFELGEEASRARPLVDPALELRHRINCRLARSYGGESYENLMMLIVAAATEGLRWLAGPPVGLRCRAAVNDGETQFTMESQISYAKSESTRPLLRVG